MKLGFFSIDLGTILFTLCNTLILKALTLAEVNTFLAKIVTEVLLFIFSYVIQHHFVFRKEHKTI